MQKKLGVQWIFEKKLDSVKPNFSNVYFNVLQLLPDRDLLLCVYLSRENEIFLQHTFLAMVLTEELKI